MALSRSRGWSEGQAFDRRMRRGQGASLVTRPNTGAVWSKQTGLWVYGEDVAFTFVNVLNPWPNGRHEVQGDLFALIDDDCPMAIERDVEIGDWLLGVAGNLFTLRPVPEGRFKRAGRHQANSQEGRQPSDCAQGLAASDHFASVQIMQTLACSVCGLASLGRSSPARSRSEIVICCRPTWPEATGGGEGGGGGGGGAYGALAL